MAVATSKRHRGNIAISVKSADVVQRQDKAGYSSRSIGIVVSRVSLLTCPLIISCEKMGINVSLKSHRQMFKKSTYITNGVVSKKTWRNKSEERGRLCGYARKADLTHETHPRRVYGKSHNIRWTSKSLFYMLASYTLSPTNRGIVSCDLFTLQQDHDRNDH